MVVEMIKEVLNDLEMGKRILIAPHALFQRLSNGVDAASVFRYYVISSLILATLTPIVNILGFPSDVIHASTNAQMTAYKYSPMMEHLTGISRHIWTGLLTIAFMILKLPVFVLFYHICAKLLGSKENWVSSLKLTVYPATPAMLFGWVPYSDFLFGLWAGLFSVPGLHYFHKIPWGKATAFAAFMVGFQILYVVLSGGGWLIEP
jgi:hypothetical protein